MLVGYRELHTGGAPGRGSWKGFRDRAFEPIRSYGILDGSIVCLILTIVTVSALRIDGTTSLWAQSQTLSVYNVSAGGGEMVNDCTIGD